MPEEIIIQNENQPDLKFEGQLIAERSVEVDLPGDDDREFTLRVYSADDGGFVPFLKYTSTASEEKSVVVSEYVDQYKDVENFFYVFEANEVIVDLEGANRAEREARLNAFRKIAQIYEREMFQFLDHVRNRAHQMGCLERPLETPRRRFFR